MIRTDKSRTSNSEVAMIKGGFADFPLSLRIINTEIESIGEAVLMASAAGGIGSVIISVGADTENTGELIPVAVILPVDQFRRLQLKPTDPPPVS